MYILNKVCLSDVPISELNMIKLSEGIRDNKYDRVKRTSHTQRSTAQHELLHAGKEKVKGTVGEGFKVMTGMEKVNGDHSPSLPI